MPQRKERVSISVLRVASNKVSARGLSLRLPVMMSAYYTVVAAGLLTDPFSLLPPPVVFIPHICMNGSSELSDALNPNYFYGRQGASHHNAPAHASSAPDSHRDELQSGSAAPSYIPNRSELENAVNASAASPHPRTNVAAEQ